MDLSRIPTDQLLALRNYSQQRMEVLRTYRWGFFTHWAQLAEVFLPRRYKWFIQPTGNGRGQALNGQIVDETGVLAARTLATGLLANLTSPTKPWFRFEIEGFDPKQDGDVQQYLADLTNRTLDVLAGSNFYTILGQAYHDLAVFGSSSVECYEDPAQVVRFYNKCLGEFFFGLDNRLTVDTLGTEFTYTVKETVDEFGINNVSLSTRQSYESPNNRDNEIVICCMTEPNTDVWANGVNYGMVLPTVFAYRQTYWEQGAANSDRTDTILRVDGFREKPFAGLRWDVTSNDAYGRSPGMDALPAVRQLQIEQRRKAEAIDKMVRPPMVASVGMKNEPMSILPGGVSYVTDPAANGFKPAYTVQPQITELREDLMEVQSRVKDIFFNTLFTGITDIEKVQTATYVDAVREEKLVMLGPVVDRMENEGLNELVERVFSICLRRGIYPPPPPAIAGNPINIKYISILAEAQRAADTAAIERVAQFAGNLAGVQPQIMDNIDFDAAIEDYADLLNVPPNVMRDEKSVMAIRAARDQQTQAAAALQTGMGLAQGAKTLSETDVGGGQNALQSIAGGPQSVQ